MRVISETRLWGHYQPLPAPTPDSGTLWEYQQTLDHQVEHVWTVIEDDCGRNWYASPGYHIVNVIGYIVTRLPWTDPSRDALYFGR